MLNHVEVAHQPQGATGRLFEARTTRGHVLVMDSGEGMVGASPVDMLLAALGGCGAMDVIDILRKKRQAVTGYRVVVDGDRREEHPRVFTHIRVHHVVRGRGVSETAVAEAIRLSDEKYCTVHAMLAGAAGIASTFEVQEG